MSDISEGYCGCGCGELTNVFRGKHRKFIKGHQARGENNSRFGIVMHDELKKKISDIRKEQGSDWWIGREHTDESKKKMSNVRKGIATTPRNGVNKKCIVCCNEFYVHPYKKDISLYCGKVCQNEDYMKRFSGENNPFFGKHLTEETKDLIRAATAKYRSLAPILPTKPEKAIHTELTKLGVKFDAEHLINGKFCVDVFVPDYNLIIYIDGCYWHACHIHCPNAKKPSYDNARIPYLTKCGYNVEIIWEHDIEKQLDEVIKNICLKYNIQKSIN
jgi:G:T-mismatch repair DNA endonuclease (very short patch repair protein)